MYYAVVTCLMLLFPVASIAAEATMYGATFGFPLIGRWFVLWSVGVRLVFAGLRQIVQPSYTAKEILGVDGEESLILVRELGFANLAIGAIGLVSFLRPKWQLAGALAGGIFYVLAGVNHLVQRRRNSLENVAMVSDLFVGLILLAVCVASLL
jgi:hypothetical protein